MSNAIQSFAVIYNNPFIFGPLFPSFYKSLGEKQKGILLSYFVLPLVLYPASLKFLVNAKSTSSIMTMVGKPGKRDRLYGLEERIAEYRELTNISIQHEIDIGMLSIDKNLSASVNSYRSTKSLGFSDYQKAASRLGYLFAPFDVPTIYRILGVKKL
jgi:hypothetical protein